MPLKINGKIELSKEGPPTSPLHATAPPGLNDVSKRLKISPLATSTPTSHKLLPIGFLAVSASSSLLKILEAPIVCRKSDWSFLPVTAVTSDPSFDKSMTEMEPTPPVAPLTTDLVFFRPVYSLKLSRA